MTGPGESAPTEMASNSTPESGTPTKGNIGNATVQSVPTTTITPIDTVLRLAHAIDLISRAVERSYINSDNIYSDKVNTANEHMRALQMKEPCGSDTKCFKRHRRAYDLELAEAEKSRITAASSIITSEVTELLGTMRSLDELLPKTLMTVRDIEFRKALSETIIIASNILTDITEHIKISRIGISNCAKLLREANDY